MKKMKVSHVWVLLDDFFYKRLHRKLWKLRIINKNFDVYTVKTTKGGAKFKISIQEEVAGVINPKFSDGNTLNCQLDNLIF